MGAGEGGSTREMVSRLARMGIEGCRVQTRAAAPHYQLIGVSIINCRWGKWEGNWKRGVSRSLVPFVPPVRTFKRAASALATSVVMIASY